MVQPLEPQQNRMQLQFDAQTCGVEISRVSYCGQTNFWPSQQIPAGLPFGMIKLSPIADDDPLARVLETARKQKAGVEKRRLQCITDAKGADAALEAATQFDSLKTGSVLRAALLAACGELDEPPCSEPDEYSSEVDLETYEPPAEAPQPEPVLEVRIVWRPGQRQL